jgi:hypothetical protein
MITMTTGTPSAVSRVRRIGWHWRHNPKRELWIAWYTTVVFYNIFTVVFFR